MSRDANQRDSARLQHEADRTRPQPRMSVMSYISILFGAAFLLLLLSYLMQARNNEEVISGLKASVSAMQSVDSLRTENTALTQQIQQLEEELARQTAAQAEDQAAAEESNARLETQLLAMDWLREIQTQYARRYYKAARTMIAEFDAAGLPQYLPAQPLRSGADSEALSPKAQYDQIVAALS